jgi:excinuclease ABC subunit C
VVFRDAKPSKKDYRHFNIRTVEGPDDFASMEEVITRRYKRMIEENQDLPQLIIIDGGKGQLSSAAGALEKLGLYGKIPIIGIAKRLEEIYFPGDSLPVYINKKSESLRLIQRMRDEAHRFGITHHRKRRSKGALVSELTSIKGIGEKTFEQLIKHFRSVKKLKEASFEELKEVVGESKANILMQGLKEPAVSNAGDELKNNPSDTTEIL